MYTNVLDQLDSMIFVQRRTWGSSICHLNYYIPFFFWENLNTSHEEEEESIGTDRPAGNVRAAPSGELIPWPACVYPSHGVGFRLKPGGKREKDGGLRTLGMHGRIKASPYICFFASFAVERFPASTQSSRPHGHGVPWAGWKLNIRCRLPGFPRLAAGNGN